MENKEWLIEKLKRLRDSYPVDDSHEGVRQGLLIAIGMIDQLLEPTEAEKVVVPQFVADWWERDDDSATMYGGESIDKKRKIHLISNFNDRGLGDHLSKVENWLDENESAFLNLVNGKPYEVEKEKLYVVELSNSNGRFGKYENVFLNKRDGVVFIDSSRLFVNDIKKYSQYALTEQEIKDYDERFWQFAVEVAE